MPRIYVKDIEEQSPQDVCQSCFEGLTEGEDYEDYTDAYVCFIYDQAYNHEPYKCSICDTELNADNYDRPGL